MPIESTLFPPRHLLLLAALLPGCVAPDLDSGRPPLPVGDDSAVGDSPGDSEPRDSVDDTAPDDSGHPDWTLATWLSIDGNAPIDTSTGDVASQMLNPALIAESGAGWVRLNFILGPWSSPEDETPHGALGLGFTDTYRVIVDGLIDQGLSVYALIGGESVYSDEVVGSDAWISDYTYNFVAIVDRFKDDVRVYESYNEPNNWDENAEPVLSSYEYASLLQSVYLETKHHNGHDVDEAWQVTLVSGPLLSFDGEPATTYLSDAWWYGRNQLAWDWTASETGSYPLDGVGYHIYVAQGETSPAVVQTAMEANLSAVQAVLDAEDPGHSRQIWISELGWTTDYVGQDGQAEALEASLSYVRDDPRIAMTSWFCLLDWPGAGYGLLESPDLAAAKPGWATFQGVAAGR